MKKILCMFLMGIMFISFISPSRSLISSRRQGIQTDFKTRSGEVSYDYTNDMFYTSNATEADDTFGDFNSTVFTISGGYITYNYTFNFDLSDYRDGLLGESDQLILIAGYFPYDYKTSVPDITFVIIYMSLSEDSFVYGVSILDYDKYLECVPADLFTKYMSRFGSINFDYDRDTVYFTTESYRMVYDDRSPTCADLLVSTQIVGGELYTMDFFTEFDLSDENKKQEDITSVIQYNSNPTMYNMFLDASKMQNNYSSRSEGETNQNEPETNIIDIVKNLNIDSSTMIIIVASITAVVVSSISLIGRSPSKVIKYRSGTPRKSAVKKRISKRGK